MLEDGFLPEISFSLAGCHSMIPDIQYVAALSLHEVLVNGLPLKVPKLVKTCFFDKLLMWYGEHQKGVLLSKTG